MIGVLVRPAHFREKLQGLLFRLHRCARADEAGFVDDKLPLRSAKKGLVRLHGRSFHHKAMIALFALAHEHAFSAKHLRSQAEIDIGHPVLRRWKRRPAGWLCAPRRWICTGRSGRSMQAAGYPAPNPRAECAWLARCRPNPPPPKSASAASRALIASSSP